MPRDIESGEKFDHDGTAITGNWIAPRNVRFAMVPLLLASNLTAGSLKVGLAALWRANGESGKCQWPYRYLGREAGLSRDGYTRALKDLEASHLCAIIRPQSAGQLPTEFRWRWDLARAFMEASEVPGSDPNPVEFLPVAPPTRKRTVCRKSDSHHEGRQSEKSPSSIRLSDEGQSDSSRVGYPNSSGTEPEEQPHEKTQEIRTRVDASADRPAMTAAGYFRSVEFSEDDLKAALNEALEDELPGQHGLVKEVRRATDLSPSRLINWRLSRKQTTPFRAEQYAAIAAFPKVAHALVALVAQRKARESGKLPALHCNAQKS